MAVEPRDRALESGWWRSSVPTTANDLRAYLRHAAVCLPGIILMAVLLHLRPPQFDDFLPFYRAGRLLGTADMFLQNAFNAKSLMFLRTPFYALLMRPLSGLAYPAARLLWTGLMIAAFALAVWFWPGPRRKIALAVCWSTPVFFALALGQDIAMVLLTVAIAARLWMSGRDFAAGLVASLLALKITLLFPVALVFLLRSRRGFFGLLAGAAAQFAASLAIQGPAWFPEYLAVMRSPWNDHVPARMPSVIALLHGVPYAVAACAIVGWLCWIARRASLPDALTVALPLGMIALPHCYAYDAAVAIPLLASVASPTSIPGMLAIVALSPLPYLFMLGDHPIGAGSAIIVIAVLAATLKFGPRARRAATPPPR